MICRQLEPYLKQKVQKQHKTLTKKELTYLNITKAYELINEMLPFAPEGQR